ncbi:MAG TPA: class I SAM-dependent methyltransferase [Ktedonosporobacter sp.]|jgi:ubiquinone/menaquinone biosynthesis C-methylase UbiE|nr:class I SAM-dependent methyltransferase [Ktedonosporobacter sp.]
MGNQNQDRWAQWLLHQRFGGDSQRLKAMLELLSKVRDNVLQHARIKEGNRILDVGCGDGLIAFGALDRVGIYGKVIFSDISQNLLDHCQALAQEMKILDRCQFVQAAAQDLSPIENRSVDVVTTRSVLIYVHEKQEAFNEFYRVLRPNGRLSIFEPINRFTYPEPPHLFLGYRVPLSMRPLVKKVWAVHARYHSSQTESMIDFDERDLIAFAERAGFSEVHLELKISIVPGGIGKDGIADCQNWETFLRQSPNPNIPSYGQLLHEALTADEMEEFTSFLRPLVETNQREDRLALAYLWAVKH